MPRPKSTDPKRAITLRLPSSVLSRYEAMGEGYRARMEAILIRAVAEKVTPKVVQEPKRLSVSLQVGPSVATPGSRLKRR